MLFDINRIAREVMEETMTGFCIECGHEQSGVEPDAEGYSCQRCGQPTVCGADTILVQGLVK